MLSKLLNRWRREDVSLPEAWRRIAHAEVIRPGRVDGFDLRYPATERITVRALVLPTGKVVESK
jgi:hypothetical protein